jgi:hypothetical protein
MVQANIYLDDKEDKIVHTLSEKWKINKNETIKKIIREFGEQNG